MSTSVRRAAPDRARRVGAAALVAALALWSVVVAGAATAAPGADWARLRVGGAGSFVAEPVGFGQPAAAGPWQLSVQQVVTGADAAALVTGASEFNDAPADGFQYVGVRLAATNTGARSFRIDANDFAVIGSGGIARRFIGAVTPDPELDATVAPGESTEGWIVSAARADETALILLYDSATLTGDWADAAIALEDGATLAGAEERAAKLNKVGRDPGRPAGIGAPVVTRDWVVEILSVVTGTDVVGLFPESDYRTTALAGADPESPATWLAVQVRVTNNRTGDQPAFFPPSAFTLADDDGNPVPDVSTLTAPNPDASGSYLPGASREGWVLFDVPPDYGGSLLRLLPYRTDDDPRYLTWGDGGVQGNTEPVFEGTLPEGTTVRTNEDEVNLRAEPSRDAEIVEVLPKGTELTVTGPPEEGDDLTWYPVRDMANGEAGYIAQQFLEPLD